MPPDGRLFIFLQIIVPGTMRLIHFGDNHLGAGSERREQDILDAFGQAIDKIIELKPDLVINAGDMFDAVRPTNRVIAYASEHLIKLGRKAGIPTVVISGNHDAPKQTSVVPVLDIFRNFDNIHVICRSQYETVILDDVCIGAVPHCLTDEILKRELAKAYPADTTRFNILVLHGVAGGIREFMMADLSEQAFDPDVFRRGFDYVALGHYHNHTRVDENVYYCGSTERLSQAEAGHVKGFVEVDFDNASGHREIRFHPLKSREMLDLPVIDSRGKSADQIVAELEATITSHQPEDKIIRVKLSGVSEETYRSLPFDKIAELKKRAFSLDVRFEKEDKPEVDYYADINIGRLDQAFVKFLESRQMTAADREELKKLAIEFLHRAESDGE